MPGEKLEFYIYIYILKNILVFSYVGSFLSIQEKVIIYFLL